ncbi:MAG TPA: tripartite tricarboxylate transporter substrate-binding protein [Candidatus Binatia bacterium]|nr:tripartite tricarboxylate transporter substrate-binding protein [Candidatus Binatia bacterium]
MPNTVFIRSLQSSRLTTACAVLLIALAASERLAHGATSFYEGKTIRIIVGTSPGGGYDTYTRLIARHFSKYIPGKPTVVVENMPGAGGLVSANHLFKVAKPDGLTIGHFVGGQFLQQLLGKPGIEFDALKFEYVGVPAQDNFIFGVAKTTGITGVEQWLASKTPVKFGAIAAGDGTYDIPKVVEVALGLPIQVVSGYKGTAPIRLAFNGGEVDGLSNSWQSLRSTWRQELETGEVLVVLQISAKPHPDLPKVPLAINLAKTDEARKLIQAVAQAHGAAVRPYVLPPGTPQDRVAILRTSFMDAIRDPELLKEAAKANLEINPGSGEDLERNVKELLRLDAALVTRLKEILK